MTLPTIAKKRVLYVITKSNFGGAQRYVFDLATHLPKERFTPTVALGGSGLLTQRLTEAGVRTLEVQHFTRDISPLRDIRAFFELIRMFRNEKPDVVHLNSAKAVTIGALAARVARVPLIISTVHGWASNEPRPVWQQVLIRCAERIGVFLAHTTIVVAKADLRFGAIAIHNGVEQSTSLPRDEARSILGIPMNAFVVGSIGELTKNKDYKTLIEAVRPTDATLVLIGDGEQKEELKKIAHERVVFAGYMTDARRLLKAFDVFVLPSKKEGLPYVLLEAGLAHLPVIATKVGGIPEIVMDEVTGMLIVPGDTVALMHALERYRENPALSMQHGAALEERVRDEFSLTRMVNQTIAHY